uniref:Myb/SANT-like domain-containing protein n=1 Tax=Zea mays TaxID=4577 RepID=A0A804PKV5_MAIZE
MQDKDKELKSHYKAVRDSRKETGVGWNDSLCMIVAEPELWEKLILAHPKVAKYQKKPFPLYYSLEA